MIIKTLMVGPIETNCYVVGDEKSLKCAVIDPGADVYEILDFMESLKLKCEAILLTHAHFDHVGAVEELMEETGAPLYICRKDCGVPIGSWGDVYNPPEGTKFYSDGQVVSVADIYFAVMETPGHTPGSVCLMCTQEGEEYKVLFTGDTLFRDSCGRTDFASSDPAAMMASLRRLYELPDDYEVYPGHMFTTSLDRERRCNYFMLMAAGR